MEINVNGQTILASAKTFSTGSRGFFATGKVVGPDGKRYQCTFNLVEIGSKPGSEAKQEKAAPMNTAPAPVVEKAAVLKKAATQPLNSAK